MRAHPIPLPALRQPGSAPIDQSPPGDPWSTAGGTRASAPCEDSGVALNEQEQQLWHRISDAAGEQGTPKAICSTITPFPFWAVIASMVIFIPLALFVSFFVSRQAIVAQGGAILVYRLSFWRFRIDGEPRRVERGPGAVERDGGKLIVGGETYHLQPGWEQAAERLLAAGSRGRA